MSKCFACVHNPGCPTKEHFDVVEVCADAEYTANKCSRCGADILSGWLLNGVSGRKFECGRIVEDGVEIASCDTEEAPR